MPYFLDGVDPRGGKACASEWRSKFTDLRTCAPEAIHICKFRNLGTWMHVDHGLYKPRQRVRTKRDTIASIASRNGLGQQSFTCSKPSIMVNYGLGTILKYILRTEEFQDSSWLILRTEGLQNSSTHAIVSARQQLN